MNDSTEMGGKLTSFPTTSWSIVRAAGDRTTPEGRAKLEQLLAAYWKPIYHHIRKRWQKQGEDAKDLTQAFLLLLLEGDYLRDRAPEHGTLRSYLKAALDHFMIDEARRSSALKRGGGRRAIDVDLAAAGETLADLGAVSPEEVFDRQWMSDCISRAILALGNSLRLEGREKYYQVFSLYYLDPTIPLDAGLRIPLEDAEGPEAPTYELVAQKLGLKEHEVRNCLVYTRRRLRELLEESIRDYSGSESDAREEIRFILGE